MRQAICALYLILFLAGPALASSNSGSTAQPAFQLQWRVKENKVDAKIPQIELPRVLSRIAAQTGWQIYVEPGLSRQISATFKDASPSEALRYLLGSLNFALLPQGNASSKLFVYDKSLQEATQLVPVEAPEAKPDPKSRIKNELIVRLRPGSKLTIEELTKKYGAKVLGKIEELNTYRLQFEDEAAAEKARQALEKESEVAGLDYNYTVDRPTRTDRLSFSSPSSFQLKATGAQDSARVVIGLIDTPVQSMDEARQQFVLPSLQVAGEAAPPSEQISHGTSMAQTVLNGLADATPDQTGSPVRILPVDVYGPNENTTTFQVARGIISAVNAGADIINLSLGSDGESPMLSAIIADTRRQGVLFFGAAGNIPTDMPIFPAAYPEVIAVTAGDRRGNIAPYANRGAFVDVIAPGVSVVEFGEQPFLISGTSSATAYVAGAAGALRSNGKDPSQTELLIRNIFAIQPKAAGNR